MILCRDSDCGWNAEVLGDGDEDVVMETRAGKVHRDSVGERELREALPGCRKWHGKHEMRRKRNEKAVIDQGRKSFILSIFPINPSPTLSPSMASHWLPPPATIVEGMSLHYLNKYAVINRNHKFRSLPVVHHNAFCDESEDLTMIVITIHSRRGRSFRDISES
jgi:hypothetical protein